MEAFAFFISCGDMTPENRRTPERTDVRDEKSGETGRHQWNKKLRLKEGSTSTTREDILQDLRENHPRDRKANSRIFRQESKNERLYIVEESVPSETEKKRLHTE
jgi:hypothetical protein